MMCHDEMRENHGIWIPELVPVFEQLDEREKNGYLRVTTKMTFDDGSTASGLTYLATADNAAYLGEASEYDIAQQICGAEGASGANCDYLLDLAVALRKLGQHDDHVFRIETHILELQSGPGPTAP